MPSEIGSPDRRPHGGKNAPDPWFVFAGGGTGGHLFPALAVVEALKAQGDPAQFSFFCTQRPIDRDILGRAGIEAIPQYVQPMPRKLWSVPVFLIAWRRSVASCMACFRRRRPAAVIGAGGYASGPAVHAALKLGIPTFLLNPDAVPGKANRHMASKAGVTGIFVQWQVSREHFPAGAPVMVTGCPVRSAFQGRIAALANRPDARSEVLRTFGLDPERRMLLVTGASQGARTVNEAIVALAETLAEARWQVLHLSGGADKDPVERAYAQVARRDATRGFTFKVLAFTDRMAEAMAGADLIVSRAGASSLAEIQAVGKPSILMPYPFHADQHQRHNASVLAKAGAAILIDDAKDSVANAKALAPVLRGLLADQPRREAMGQAASRLDRPESAELIAEVLRKVSELPADEKPRLIIHDPPAKVVPVL